MIGPRLSAAPSHARALLASSIGPLLVVALYIVVSSSTPFLYGWLLAPLLAGATAWLMWGQWPVGRGVWFWPVVLSSLGAIGLLVGVLNHNQGARSMMTVFVIEPLVLGLLFGMAMRARDSRMFIVRVLDVATIVVAVLGLFVWLLGLKEVSAPTFIFGNFTAIDTINLRTNYQGYNSFIFLFPYAATRFASSPGGGWAWRSLVLASAVSGVVLSGRQILLLIVPIAVAFALLALSIRSGWHHNVARHARWYALGALVAVSVAVLFVALSGWNMTTLETQFGDGSGDVRTAQSSMILDRWMTSPWLGHGLGAEVPGLVRNEQSPWLFEVSYHAILLYVGLFGMAVLVAWGAWIAVQLARAYVRDDRVAQAVAAGWVGTLIAIATNPYVFHLDGLWMVMLPYGLAFSLALPRSAEGHAK